MRLNQPRQGSVLVAVLVVLGLATAILWLIQATALARASATQLEQETISGQAVAFEAIRAGMQQLADDEDLLVDHLGEPWALPFTVLSPSGVETEVIIRDENRYFDLNNAPIVPRDTQTRPVSEVLNDLFRLCGMSTGTSMQVEALVDAVDANNNGAFEDPEEFKPANAPLTTWTDLFLVPGVSPIPFLAPLPDPDRDRAFGEPEHPRQIFTILPDPQSGGAAGAPAPPPGEPSSPVPPTTGDSDDRRLHNKVNINTAPPYVLRGVIGNTPQRAALVEQFLAYRKETPIREIGSYLGRLPPADVEIASAYLDTKSGYFTIVAVTRGDEPTVARALVERGSDGTVELLKWLP